MSFCNSSIKPLRIHKPHIVFIDGYWRLSVLRKPYLNQLSSQKYWQAAHKFVLNKNDELNYPWGYRANS